MDSVSTPLVLHDQPCELPDCPQSSYQGLSMKRCTVCNAVQYCSRDCQRADWSEHKKICSGYEFLESEVRRWLSRFGYFFRWAALQAMGAEPTRHLASNHCLLFEIISNNELSSARDPPAPLFLVNSLRLSPFKTSATAKGAYSSRDRKASVKLRKAGGLGRMLAVFKLRDTSVFFVEKYNLREPLCGVRLDCWADLVMRLVRGSLSVAQFGQLGGGQRMRVYETGVVKVIPWDEDDIQEVEESND